MLSLLLYGALALLLVLAFVWAWRSSKNIGSDSVQREAEILARVHSGKDPFTNPQEEAARKAKEAAQHSEAQGVESLFAGIPSESVPGGQIDVADVTEAVDIERLLAGESLAVVTRARARLEEPTNLAIEGDTLPPRPAPPPLSAAPTPIPVGDSWAARAAASAIQKKEDAARVFEQQRFTTERDAADQVAEQRATAERMAAERAAQQQRAMQLKAEQQQAEQQEMERRALVQQEQERQEIQRQEWARQEIERKRAEQRFEEQRIAALQAEQALLAQRQAQLAHQRALEAERSKVPVPVGGAQSLDRNLPLRELTLAWFEARGYRSAPASPALRPIELVLRHKDDPARVYGFVVEDAHVQVQRVKDLREQAKSVGLMRMLIVANAGADPEAYEVLRKKGVRIMDRAAVEQEFSELDFSIAAKIIAVARKRAALS